MILYMHSFFSSMIRARNTTSKGCSFCSSKKVTRENSFASLHPEVMDEYDPSNDIDPYAVTEYSTKIAKWICRNNNEHRWDAPFQWRARGQGSCSICRGYQYGKMFYEDHEEYEQYYDNEKNDRPFHSLSNMSNDYVWWKCPFGHSFERTVYNMTRKKSFKCPICENLIVQTGENDLASQYPDLAKEFDTEKNHVLPQNITIASSSNETWWKCSEGHEFQRSVYNRIHHFSECPICNRTVVVKGVNDFLHTYPMINDIWDRQLNDRNPEDISDRSTGNFHFKCEKGHQYYCSLSTIKANGFECLVCNNKIIQEGVNSLVDTDYELSQEFSPNEERKPSEFTSKSAYWALWRCKVCNNDYHWPIKERSLNDQSCPFCNNRYTKLGVNSLIDTHPELAKEYAPDNEYDVTRVNKDSKSWAYWICPKCHGRYGAYVNEREVGDDSCPYCRNIKALKGFNSLLDTHSLLAKEWSPNNERDISEFTKNNVYEALWECPTCHGEYAARICEREIGDDSCPYCKNKRTLPGFNSLTDTHKLLADEWSPNNERDVSEFTKSHSYTAIWRCSTCHGEYAARICDREVRDDSCPYCRNKKVLPGFNSLVDTHSLLVNEWSPNNEYEASEFTKSSTYRALWECSTCHGEYYACIRDREVGDDSCPYCRNKKVLPGFNSLDVKHPELLGEWDYINNYFLCSPDEILDTHIKDVWWNCKVCGSKYPMSPKKKLYYQHRHMKSCPYCKGFRRKKRYFY